MGFIVGVLAFLTVSYLFPEAHLLLRCLGGLGLGAVVTIAVKEFQK